MTFFPEASFRQLPLLQSGPSIDSILPRTCQSVIFLCFIAFSLPPLLVLRFPLPHHLSSCIWRELASVLVFLLNSEMLTGPVTLI